jgi:FLVCR family feline leukemia virus subgroup C receptor-related protein
MTVEMKYRDLPIEPPVELIPVGEKGFHGGDVLQCKVYKRRWLILLIFVLLSIVNTSQWTQYAIINNIVIRYYQVESVYVEWTAIIFMAAYVAAIIPVLMLLEKKVCTNCYLQISI